MAIASGPCALIDYGAGNLASVARALEHLGAAFEVAQTPGPLERADRIVLPGVGAFGEAVAELGSRGLLAAVRREIEAGKPFLGICLGLQILFEESEESLGSRGLGMLAGKVARFPAGVRVPHIGWSETRIEKPCPIFQGIAPGAFFYYVHSYRAEPLAPEVVCATADYGRPFPAAVWSGNVFGVQFHPEKSQDAGLALLQNFLRA